MNIPSGYTTGTASSADVNGNYYKPLTKSGSSDLFAIYDSGGTLYSLRYDEPCPDHPIPPPGLPGCPEPTPPSFPPQPIVPLLTSPTGYPPTWQSTSNQFIVYRTWSSGLTEWATPINNEYVVFEQYQA